MYCDNVWPLAFERMWADFASRSAAAQVTVYRNRDGYTRDNVRVGSDGMVEVYDKSRTARDLQGVDIGFLIVDREVVRLLPEHDNISFERYLYPRLIAERTLAAFETDHRYYSVSTPERLAETERFLTRRPCVILDRDGVLNAKQPKATWVTSPEQWRLAAGRARCAGAAHRGRYRARGGDEPGRNSSRRSHRRRSRRHSRPHEGEAAARGAKISTVYACPHDWDSKCDCRKPKPGMLLQAQREHALDLSVTPFIGDDERDGIAAAAAGCPFFRVDPEKGLAQVVAPVLDFVRAHQRKSAWEPC